MRSIYLKDICKSFDGNIILNNFSLTVPEGKFFALLGPSGCGKTTVLRLIGGFELPDSGTIMLGDENITDLPIYQRKVNTVFQSYALFPHMNVFDNVAYSLKIKKMTPQYIKERVTKVLKAVSLDTHMYRAINQLSGGQQQRVALARAIINEPQVLLLDEPLAALDLKLREQMLIELIDLQETLKTTFVYVTHDQTEALTLADQIAILNHDGEIEQIGTPQQIYEFPISSFVGTFVGKMNLFNGTLSTTGDSLSVHVKGLGGLKVYIGVRKEWMIEGADVIMGIRPEKIWISKEKEPNFPNVMIAKVEAIVYHGPATQYNVRLKDDRIIQVFEQNEEHFPKEKIDYDDQVFLHWRKESALLFER
ncbi:ABC transporter ATP-binding protein [Candidatus Babeliales bacterium]|nr:ABC transporter ATP-binding protein [Candidatus Babeliales bacterium]